MTATLIIDDHPLARVGTKAIIDSIEGFHAEVTDAAAAVIEVRRHRPDLVLLGADRPGADTWDLLRRLVRSPERPRVALFVVSLSPEEVRTAIRLGATGVLVKDATHEELVAGVRALAAGLTVLSRGASRRLADTLEQDEYVTVRADRARKLTSQLSAREREILTMVAQGMSNNEIGGRLFLGTATVKEYVSAILGKVGVKNRLQAALIGYEAGLLSADASPRPGRARRHDGPVAGHPEPMTVPRLGPVAPALPPAG